MLPIKSEKNKGAFFYAYSISALIFLAFLSIFIQKTVGMEQPTLIHAILELTAIAMALMMFAIIWYSYERVPPYLHFIAFGYLTITSLLVVHTIYYHHYMDTGDDLALVFMLITRLTEAIIYYGVAAGKFCLARSKWGWLIVSLYTGLAIFMLVMLSKGNLPMLYTPDGFTGIKYFWEFIILTVLLVSIIKMKRTNRFNEIIGHEFVYYAGFIALGSNLCFLLQPGPMSFLNILGHILRIFCYYHLFKGVFVCSINYPYERMQEVWDHLPLAITTYDASRRLVSCNKKALEITGYTSTEVFGHTDEWVINRVYYDREKPHVINNLQERSFFLNQLRAITTKQGEIKRIIIDAYKLKSGGYLCVFDEAKRVQALENMQLQTQTILNSVSNLVALINPKKEIVMCNKAMAEACEMEISEIVGKNAVELVKALQSDSQELTETLFIKKPANQPVEIMLVTPNGNKKTWLVSVGVLKNIDGDFIGGIMVGTDITGIKKEQAEITQQEKLALLGQMASGIVHELKNPMTAIMGFNQIIKIKADNEYIRELCTYVEKEIQNLNKIITDFLLFARPQPPVKTEISPNAIVESMKVMIDSYVFTKGIKISYDLQDNLRLINADENQVKQVILNIMKNAIDVLLDVENPEIHVITGTYPLFDESFIRIHNNGRALTREEKGKIGTPFFTTKAKGTGLGLSICQQIMREHEGRINVYSEEGFGTAFELIFPACELHEEKAI